ncbi:protein tesmin/TSO1-like CXC 6 [Humulus lupulus]|uniref:protein tesmin/TSO1-like CXC 6 n=1 Tax=Humulus lupulus TaxID=3486 RepID=UPI002B40F80A|nr:protein tesmin/TSO1-like CXC 6 [Humulus lupulus]
MVIAAHADRIHATDVNEQKGMVLSRRVEALSSDENVTMLSKDTASPDGNHKWIPNAKVYMEQEKIVLTSFRDFLKKIISCKHETWGFDRGSM